MATKKRPIQDVEEDQVEENRGLLSSIGNSIGQLFGFGGAKRRKTTREENRHQDETIRADRNAHPSPPSTLTPATVTTAIADSTSKETDTNGAVRDEKAVKFSPQEPSPGSLPYYRTANVNASSYSVFSSSFARNASSRGKSIRFQETNLKSTPGQMKYRSTPYKKQSVAFESATTPNKTNGRTTMEKTTYAKTPIPTRTTGTGIHSTGVVQLEERANTMKSTPVYTPKYKANARTTSMLTIASNSALRKDSEQQRKSKDDYTRQVVRDILDKSSTVKKVYESDATTLFSPPQEREKIKATRIYGRNQSGSRMIQPLKATSTPSKDYWSRVSVSDNALPVTSHDETKVATSTTPRMDTTTAQELSTSASNGAPLEVQALKRTRVEFAKPDHSFGSFRRDSTPPKTNDTPSSAGAATSSMSLNRSTPIKKDVIVEYVQGPDVAFPRNNTGTVNYPNEKMYRQDIVLGESSKGVTKDEARMEDLKTRIRPKTKFYFRKNGTTNAASKKPFDSMPMENNDDGSRKGSSSILHQPLQTLSKLKGKESNTLPAISDVSDQPSAKALAKEDASGKPAVESGWGNIFASQKDKHKCVSCSTLYDKHLSKCPACETTKEPQDSEKTVETSSVSTSGWGNIFASQKDKHKCVSCSTQYDKHLSKCPACETPKESDESKKENAPDTKDEKVETSSTTAPSFSFGTTPSSTNSATTKVQPANTFTFGASTAKSTESSSKFTFGAISSSTPAPAPASSGFTFGATSSKSEENSKPAAGGFSFGASSTVDKEEGEKSKLFTFGATTTSSDSEKSKEEVSKPATTNFTFGTSSSSTAEKSEDKKPEMSSVTFGASSISAPEGAKDTGSKAILPAFTFGTTTSSSGATGETVSESKPTANLGFSFGSSTTSIEKKEEPTSKRQRDDSTSAPVAPLGSSSTPAPSFSFGASSAQETKSTGDGSGFGTEMKSESKPVPTAAPFTFGSSSGDGNKLSSTSSSSKFTFGSSTNTEQVDSKSDSGGFTLGSVSTGTNQHDPLKSTSTPSFTFGAGSSSVAPASTSPPFTFGSTTTTAPSAPAPAPAFSFGQSSQTAPTPAPSFSFGSTAGTTPVNSSTFNTPAPAFSFGAPSSASAAPTASSFTAATPAMTFGTTPATSSTAPFAFGASNQMASTSGPSFGGFGSGASSPAPPFGNTPSAPAPTFAGFGAPMQQQSQGGGFASGQPTAPAAGGFNIGTGGSSKQATGRGGRRVIRAKRPPSNR
jgi:hypothetical protein